MADHEKAFLICENKCLVEGVPMEQYEADTGIDTSRFETIEAKDSEQDGRLDSIEQVNTEQGTAIATAQSTADTAQATADKNKLKELSIELDDNNNLTVKVKDVNGTEFSDTVGLPSAATATLKFMEPVTGVTYTLTRHEDGMVYTGTVEDAVNVPPGYYDILLTDGYDSFTKNDVHIAGITNLSGYSVEITWAGRSDATGFTVDGRSVTFPIYTLSSSRTHTVTFDVGDFQFDYTGVWQASHSTPVSGTYYSKNLLTLAAGDNTIAVDGDYDIAIVGGGAGGSGGGAGGNDDETWGGGGSGGGGGAGGSGRISVSEAKSLSAGDVLTLTKGSAGSAGSGGTIGTTTTNGTSGSAGGSGGTTTLKLNGTTLITAAGGSAGTGGGYGKIPSNSSYYGGAGGSGGTGGNGGSGGGGGEGGDEGKGSRASGDGPGTGGYNGYAYDANGTQSTRTRAASGSETNAVDDVGSGAWGPYGGLGGRPNTTGWTDAMTFNGKSYTKISGIFTDGAGFGGKGGTGGQGSGWGTSSTSYANRPPSDGGAGSKGTIGGGRIGLRMVVA